MSKIVHGYPIDTSKNIKIYDEQFRKYLRQVNKQLRKDGYITIFYNKNTFNELIEYLKEENRDENIQVTRHNDYITIEFSKKELK